MIHKDNPWVELITALITLWIVNRQLNASGMDVPFKARFWHSATMSAYRVYRYAEQRYWACTLP